MTDNSSLIPSQSSPNFTQQGQFDWVAVARTPVTFTIEVLARYGRAGVDALTVGIARAVCSEFDLKPAAQKRLEESISKLKTVPSFGKIAWFGFGLKHIIDDLLETEQGASCVALSGCLTTSYDTDFASQVFRSICQNKGAPKSLTPSLRQWSALVRVCAGSLTNSQFPHLLIGFERLLAMHLQDQGCRAPPHPDTLARAIVILGSLSRGGDLRGATFSGGLDCAWIAAMAEWMLCLGVEINDSSGNPLYRSKSLSSGEIAHVIINIDGSFSKDSSDLTHKTFCIPSGEDILRRTTGVVEPFNLRSAVRRSVPWTDILDATFGQETILSLLHAPRNAFAAIIASAPSLLNPNEPGYDLVHTDLSEPNGSQRGIDFLEWAMWRLPELRPCIESSVLPSSHYKRLKMCWELIGEACGCNGCLQKAPMNFMLIPEKECCLKVVALTIVDYLILLFRTSIDPLILPSCNGLRLLYAHKARQVNDNFRLFEPMNLSGYVMKDAWLPDILEYLTGQSFHGDRNPHAKSALSANGICIFFNIFLDLDVPPLEINTIQVIPGYIEFEDSQCETAIDIANRPEIRLRSRQLDEKDFSYNMVVKQKVHDTDIGVGYQMCVRGGGTELGGLCSILSNAMRKITFSNCTTWCQVGGHETDKRSPGQKATMTDKPSTNDQWMAVVLTRQIFDNDYNYTLESFRCCYPRMYLNVLWDSPDRQACLVRINNCSKCLFMYAAETLFVPDKKNQKLYWKAKGIITIRRLGAEDVKIEMQGEELEVGRGDSPIETRFGLAYRTPNEVETVPLFPHVPLDHDPVF